LRFLKILNVNGEWLIFLIWKVLGSNLGSKTSCSVWCSSFPQSLQEKRIVPVITLLQPPLVSSPITCWLSCHLTPQKWDVDSFMKTRFQKMCVVYTERVHWAALITCDMLRYFYYLFRQTSMWLLLLLLLLLLLTAIGLSHSGSGYFTCTQIWKKSN
jgi:hypothetical protein